MCTSSQRLRHSLPTQIFPSSWFSGCWSWTLAIWKFTVHILSKTGLLACEMMQLCSSLSILWCCFTLGLEWKLTFSSPVATAEFSKFAGILSAALSQHHLLGLETSSTGILSPALSLFIEMLPKDHLTSHSRMSGSRWVIMPSWLSGSWRIFFCIVLLCILATSS